MSWSRPFDDPITLRGGAQLPSDNGLVAGAGLRSYASILERNLQGGFYASDNAVAAISFLAPTAFAQTETPKGFTDTYTPVSPGTYAPATSGTGAPATSAAPSALPFGGPLPEVNTGPGLIVRPDGVSTKTVKAVPCSPAARETDGTTTCVGISEAKAEKRR